MNIFKNFRYKLLAFLLAVIFWVAVISLADTVVKYDQPLPIQAFNMSEQVSLVNPLGEANVFIRADKEVLKTLVPADFEVYVDLAGMTIGEVKVPVSVTSKKGEVTVLRVEPENIEVELEAMNSKTAPVSARVIGDVAPGFDFGLPQMNVTTIKVSGAESVLEKVVEVEATLFLEGREMSDVTKQAELLVVDALGNEVKNVELAKTDITLVLPVYQVSENRTVSIKPTFYGTPENHWVTDISIMPSTVVIEGDMELLETVSYLDTEHVDSSKAGAGEQVVSLLLPEGIELVDTEQQTVIVTFTVEAIPYEKQVEAEIRVTNIPDDEYLIDPTRVALMLQGDPTLLNSLKPSDYYIELDLADYAGVDEIELAEDLVTVPDGVTVTSFTPLVISYDHL